jgi:hypothetical protein
MKNYIVTVTGTWNMDVKASSPDEAEYFASVAVNSVENRVEIYDMNLEFEAFEENEDGI